MTDKKEKQRFIFFKYVPPTSGERFGSLSSDAESLNKSVYPSYPDEQPVLDEQTIPDEHSVLDEQILPDEHSILDEQILPDEYSVLDEQTLPDEQSIFDEQTIPDEQSIFDEQTIPDEQTILDEQTLPDEQPCYEPSYPYEPPCPEEPTEEPCPENAIMHEIKAGDTFWKLAKKYGTTVEAIAAANPDLDPLNLQIGETVCIPVGIPGAKG